MTGSDAFPGVRPETRIREHLMALVVVMLVLVGVVCIGWLGTQTLLLSAARRYEGRVYPNVHCAGVALAGMDEAEAADALRAPLAALQAPRLVFTDGQRQWAVSWAEAGVRYDAEATARAALAVGRDEPDLSAGLAFWLGRYDIQPAVTIDTEAARLALRTVGMHAAVPPVEAGLALDGERLVAVPGEYGSVLDEDTTLARLIEGVTTQRASGPIEIALQPIAPRVSDVSSLLPEAERLVSARLELAAYDMLRNENLSWTPGRRTIAGWLSVASASGEGPELAIDHEAIRATLAGLAAEIGEGRGFRLDEAVEQVAAALQAGGGMVTLYLTHPEGVYVVQPMDSLISIAVSHGLPPAVLAEANPAVIPDRLQVGQELVIPSPDVLWPHMPVANKRIVINLGRQRMQVFENGALLWDWPVSTGIPDSPTVTGTFQILEKVESAYANQWSLLMPHFLSVYQAGPDLYNGIHALPINAGGVRLWEGLLGRPASYGCIILGVQEAAMLYDWAELGVPVVIEP